MIHVSKVLPGELHVLRIKACVCGGQVRADIRFPTEGVARHNRTKRHQAWRARREDGTEPWVKAA